MAVSESVASRADAFRIAAAEAERADHLEAQLAELRSHPPTSVRPELYTVAETAELLKCGVTTVYRLLDAGALSYVQLASDRRVTGAELQRYIDANTRNGRAAS